MYDGNAQKVLRCVQCNKPFDKESTLKRHGYYCRSRREGKTIRTRSCVSCARSKARCDSIWPRCSRCMTKRLECQYPSNVHLNTRPKTQHSYDTATKQRIRRPSLVTSLPNTDAHEQTISDVNVPLDGGLVIPNLGFEKTGETHLDWDSIAVDFNAFMDPLTDKQTAEYSPLDFSDPLHTYTFRSSPPEFIDAQHLLTPPISIPASPTALVRALLPRTLTNTSAKRPANLILHTLKSYPRMMQMHGTLPPFIHPAFISSSSTMDIDPLESVTNCINLVHMISHGVRGNRKLFWRNVRWECERICGEIMQFNKWQLLSAMQALSIYILIRLDEGETEHNNIDILMCSTVVVIAKRLTCSDILCTTPSAACSYADSSSWNDWVYEESRRRLSVVYRCLGMLVYFAPLDLCELQSDLILAPLPGKKRLWEANEELLWKAEIDKEASVHNAFALAASGDLVVLDEEQSYCTDAVLKYKALDTDVRTKRRSITGWEDWCVDMDGFGGLVMLAASLLG